MLIQELESATKLDRATIRYYEKEGLITPGRSENGYRNYSDDDVENLIRIKLMRQLGVPLGKVKDLLNGTENFAVVLDAQIKTLTSQIERDKRAKAVCFAILSDNADFATLDASYYLRMFDQQLDHVPNPTLQFREQVPEQIHPWRRLFARLLDYALISISIQFVMFVIFRIRPIPVNSTLYSIILPTAAGALFIPLEAAMLHFWGTTPGKQSFGIRIERIEGGLLSFGDAFDRAKQVFFGGVGLRLPIISDILMFYNYCKLTGRSFWLFARHNSIAPPYDMEWDYRNEIYYDCPVGKRRITLACTLLLSFILMSIATNDYIKPRYRGSDITIEQFSNNYNNSAALINDSLDNTDKLRPDGTWYEADKNVVVLSIGSTPKEENPDFIYQTDSNVLRSITYKQHWTEVTILSPYNYKCRTAAVSMLMAQKGTSLLDYIRFEQMLNAQLSQPSGSFQFKNLLIEWSTAASNNLYYNRSTSMYYSSDDRSGELEFQFTITLI